ncbi:MAG: Stp1/IreP family PP2C-type Ser/Thr phosphatase [Christensenellaceae bacterium]|nr:Stp1/IreP family PP2C-type Ser/Thr phosphatase [Christensenellaceae bacterium]
MGVYVVSDRGNLRPNNEDSVFAPAAGTPLALVCDGMGGHKAGEVASAMAVETISKLAQRRGGREISVKAATAWVKRANRALYDAAQADEARRGMGTTATMLYFSETSAMLAHVGDSRAYRLRGGELARLTQDHSLVAELVRMGEITEEQAREHPYRNVITRALGSDPDIEVDARDFDRLPGDLYLLCSDGLTGYLHDEELRAILLEESSLEEKGQKLLRIALERGGRDNISLVLTDGEVSA